jgi:hypothetical protein
MKYSIQNAFGEVYGISPTPRTTMSAEVLAHALREELHDILGINGVRDSPLRNSASGYEEGRVVVDIEPVFNEEDARIARVHETVSRLTPPRPGDD